MSIGGPHEVLPPHDPLTSVTWSCQSVIDLDHIEGFECDEMNVVPRAEIRELVTRGGDRRAEVDSPQRRPRCSA